LVDVPSSLRAFEKRRAPRCAKLTIKAGVLGGLLQIAFPPVTFVRDNIAIPLYSPKSFLEHTDWVPPPRPQPRQASSSQAGGTRRVGR
jgi:hypothetical protein